MKTKELYSLYLNQQKNYSTCIEQIHHDAHYDQDHIDSVDHEDN